MSRKLKVKIAALVLVAAASMAVMGVLLSTMQTLSLIHIYWRSPMRA